MTVATAADDLGDEVSEDQGPRGEGYRGQVRCAAEPPADLQEDPGWYAGGIWVRTGSVAAGGTAANRLAAGPVAGHRCAEDRAEADRVVQGPPAVGVADRPPRAGMVCGGHSATGGRQDRRLRVIRTPLGSSFGDQASSLALSSLIGPECGVRSQAAGKAADKWS